MDSVTDSRLSALLHTRLSGWRRSQAQRATNMSPERSQSLMPLSGANYQINGAVCWRPLGEPGVQDATACTPAGLTVMRERVK